MAEFVTANRWASGVATHKTKDGRILCTGVGCIGCFPDMFKSKAKEYGVCGMDGHPFRTFLNEDRNQQVVAKRSRNKLRAKVTKTATQTPQTQKDNIVIGTQNNSEISFDENRTESLQTENVLEFFAQSSLSCKTKDELARPVGASTCLQSLNKSKLEVKPCSNNDFSDSVTKVGEIMENCYERDVNSNHKWGVYGLSSAVQKWIGISQPSETTNTESNESHSVQISNCTCSTPRANKSVQTENTDLWNSHPNSLVEKKQLAKSITIFDEIHDNIYFLHQDNKALNKHPGCSLERENAVRLFFAIEYFHSARIIPNFTVLEVVEALSHVVGPGDIKYVQQKDHKWHMVLRTRKSLGRLQRSGIKIRGRVYDLFEDDDKYFEIVD